MGFFSWLFNRKGDAAVENAPPASEDAELERLFTDAEEARRRFDELIGSEPLTKRVVVVHGVGAVGKSSLLQMFRLACRRQGVAVALTGGEEAASIVDLLARWAADLGATGAALPTVTERVDDYRRLQHRAEEEASNAEDQLAKAGGAAVGLAVGLVPVAGTLLKDASADAAEALINLLRARFSRDEFEFFRDPTGPLTDAFHRDVAAAASRRRIVLMLDTVEQAAGLSAWLGEVTQRLPANVLVVVAGRVLPAWDARWPSWLAAAERIELREMGADDVRRLVRQYCEVNQLQLTSEQVEHVVAFARGLPMAATSAARLLALYEASGVPASDPRVIADLADQVLRGVPAVSRPAFEAAAVLRAFNADSLEALLGDGTAQTAYDELRRWPFTRAKRHHLAVHDTMREVMNEALRARSPQRFRDLNARAARHYEALAARPGEESDRQRLEWLYHHARADEWTGVQAFRAMAEELVRYKGLARLRALLDEVGGYAFDQENSRLWVEYYRARLTDVEGLSARAESAYKAIASRESADATVRAYALCDLGALYAALDRLAEPGGEQRAVDAAQRSLQLAPEPDTKLIANHITLMNISNSRAAWDESSGRLQPVREFARARDDTFGLVMADRLQAAIDGLQGDWRKYLDARERCLQAVDRLGDVPSLQLHVAYLTWPLVFMGRCREAQLSGETALRCAERLEERELMITILESIGLALGMQGLAADASARFEQAMNFFGNFHLRERADAGNPDRHIRALLSFRGLVALRHGQLDEAEDDLGRALAVKKAIGDRIGLPEVHVWMGELHETRGDLAAAAAAYQDALDLRSVSRMSFESQALAGLARIRLANGATADAEAASAGAEALARRMGYIDVLASLRLAQGHAAWDSAGAAEAEAAYRQALIHSVGFNRFLLDTMLAGTAPATPVEPLIPACWRRGDGGRDVLESLLDWWRNDARLTAAEAEARAREPADGGEQETVVERLEAALA